MAGNAAQTSREMPAKINFLRAVAVMAWATLASSNAFTDERLMIGTPGSASTSSGKVGPHMLSRAVVVTTIGNFSALAALAKPTTLLQLSCRIIAYPCHQAHLVVDEDERGVFRRERLVGAVLLGHDFLLQERKVSCGCGERCDAKHCRGGAEPRGLKKLTPFHPASLDFGPLHRERDCRSSICARETKGWTAGLKVAKIVTQRPTAWTIAMLDFNDFFYFVQVVDRDGFTAAAQPAVRTLQAAKPPLSRRAAR
jgi:hypothetical protein